LHPQAFLAAEAAEAAGAQNKFWEMHALLLEKADQIDDDNLKRWAQKLKIDARRFMLDLSDSRYAGRVYEGYQAACAAGVSQTPALYINSRCYEGPLTLGSLSMAVQHEWYGARQAPIMRSTRFDVPYISPAVIREIQKIAAG
jgi:protein-disulfide isomerase